jgi:hypothetical protein
MTKGEMDKRGYGDSKKRLGCIIHVGMTKKQSENDRF